MKYSYVQLLTDDPLNCVIMYSYNDDSAWYELARCSRNQVLTLINALKKKNSPSTLSPHQFDLDV